MRHVRIAIMVLFGVLVLSSCLARIPDSGNVSYGAEAYAPSSQNFVRTLVSPPTPGVNPQALIREFLAAVAGDQGDYATSRLYLTPDAAALWQPSAGVRIYADQLRYKWGLVPREANSLTFAGPEVGTIDSQGHYQATVTASTLLESYSVIRVNGEWRISSLADGVALSESDVARAFRQLNVYFLTPSKRTLVPDPVYLPVNLGISTALTQALLAGPTRWLAPAVTSAIPPDASLVAGSVPIQQGVAQVDLALPLSSISPLDRQALSAQVIWTLKQIAEVAAVRITIGRAPLIVPGMGEAQSRFAYSSFSPDVLSGQIQAFAIGSKGLIKISDLTSQPKLTAIKGPANKVIRGFSSAAISLDGTTIAGITSDNSLVSGPLTGPLQPTVLAGPDTTLFTPSWDESGVLWVLQAMPSLNQIYAILPGSPANIVNAPPLKTMHIRAFHISRDGSRVAYATGADSASRLFIARVIRSSYGGKPSYRIESPIELSWSGGDIGAINWADSTHLSILTSGDPKSVWNIAIDNSESITEAGIVDPVAIASAPGMPRLASNSAGRLYAFIGQSWVSIGNARYPIYPG